MNKLPKPSISATDCFDKCTNTIRDKVKKEHYRSISSDIVVSENEYDQKGLACCLHTIHSSNCVGNVTVAEMSKLYSDKLANKNGSARDYYNEILFAPVHEICPLCGQKNVGSLDHFLPKANYPVLAVTPVNLVPACNDCNKMKHEKVPESIEEVFIHPYYDSLDERQWLLACVNETMGTLEFSVNPFCFDGEEELYKRVLNQFNTLKLAKLYAVESAVELVEVKSSLRGIHATSGLSGVRSYLQDRHESIKCANLKAWRIAAYLAVSTNDWFCDGGFNSF